MATIRIVAGERRGHRLAVAGHGGVRPTSEKVREAVFDVLGSVDGDVVLDLFAGSGALGLEALSRGAARATFVEAERSAARILRQNISALQYVDRSRVIVADHGAAVRRMVEDGEVCDLLFLDPPYRMLPRVVAGLRPFLPSVLAPDGRLVIEGPVDVSVDDDLGVVFRRRYGRTLITIVRGGASTT
jgi:16S rRNA (guanine966-N2)-methyltransferase